MKTKLQALILEQKALTARFEELLKETTYKPYAFIGNSEHWENIRKYLDPKGDDNLYRFKDKASLYLNIDDVIICDNATDKFRLLVSQTHTIIDLNEQPDFFEKLNNSDNSNNPDPKKVYIKGHSTRGAEVIKMLEDLGGNNSANLEGCSSSSNYFISNDCKTILAVDAKADFSQYTELHLPNKDLPKKEVELIGGEVYVMGNCIGIFKERISNNHTKWYCVLESAVLKSYEVSYGQCLNATLPSSAQLKQLLEALEQEGKYFDKENMRLLDVEEWSGKVGEAFIYVSSKGFWEAAIFDDKSNYNNAPFYFIPYNDQTKSLIGTSNSPNKHYKFINND